MVIHFVQDILDHSRIQKKKCKTPITMQTVSYKTTHFKMRKKTIIEVQVNSFKFYLLDPGIPEGFSSIWIRGQRTLSTQMC